MLLGGRRMMPRARCHVPLPSLLLPGAARQDAVRYNIHARRAPALGVRLVPAPRGSQHLSAARPSPSHSPRAPDAPRRRDGLARIRLHLPMEHGASRPARAQRARRVVGTVRAQVRSAAH
eukprot:2003137-Prymnesium_polylepis.1